MTDTIYLVQSLTIWKDISASMHGHKFPVDIPESGDGFMPVYFSLDEAKKEYPNSRILEFKLGKVEDD